MIPAPMVAGIPRLGHKASLLPIRHLCRAAGVLCLHPQGDAWQGPARGPQAWIENGHLGIQYVWHIICISIKYGIES